MLHLGISFKFLLLIATLVLNFAAIEYHYYFPSTASALSHPITVQSAQGPLINDPKLKAEVVFKGLNFPTSMAFLGPNDILVLEKNDGTVRRIVNGTMLPHPLLHVNVANQGERGMLGIAITKNKNVTGTPSTYVYLYYTESTDYPISNIVFQDNQSSRLPSYWNDSLRSCYHVFKCAADSTMGWTISTNTTEKRTWSFIYGSGINVNPGQHYILITHMKLNEFATQSHIAIEGYNETSKKWNQVDQITQCPSGTNGSLSWQEFRCEITIPKYTSKIRPILNAGWSSQPGKVAVTSFDGIYLLFKLPILNADWSSQPGKEAVTSFDGIYLSLNGSNNRLFRYELLNDKLVNPKLLLNLPSGICYCPQSFIHNGGKIVIGPDKSLYIIVGNVDEDTKAQNIVGAKDPDGTGGILRVTQDGKPVKGILGDKFPLNLYYAYGIRNSFGIDFDPITKKLWDTENGAECCDEINFVDPGFNSGWTQVQGIWARVVKGDAEVAGRVELNPPNLVDFGGKGKYRSPEFTWYDVVAPTGLKFLNSDKLGRQYKDDMFVGDFHFGNLYHFKLNEQRNRLLLSGPLASKIAVNNTNALKSIIFGHGFGGITDLEVGPDGYLYVLSLYAGGDNCDPIHPRPCIQYNSPLPGTIFRIVPTTNAR